MPDTDDFKALSDQAAIAYEIRKARSSINHVSEQLCGMIDAPSSTDHVRAWARRQETKLFDAMLCLQEIERRNGKAVKDA